MRDRGVLMTHLEPLLGEDGEVLREPERRADKTKRRKAAKRIRPGAK